MFAIPPPPPSSKPNGREGTTASSQPLSVRYTSVPRKTKDASDPYPFNDAITNLRASIFTLRRNYSLLNSTIVGGGKAATEMTWLRSTSRNLDRIRKCDAFVQFSGMYNS
jgi:hypothetical protein